MVPLIRQDLARAQQRMKMQADKHRSERMFQVGDRVYLHLQPYVQSSVAECSSQKLSFKYFGPYLVLQRVGQVAYKLQLPPSARIHPVVHVSQLKKAIPPQAQVCASLPSYMLTHEEVFPLSILQDRLVRRVMRVNLKNVLNKGLRIGETGHRMNSKVKLVKIGVCQK
jgi:hypothetical protein